MELKNPKWIISIYVIFKVLLVNKLIVLKIMNLCLVFWYLSGKLESKRTIIIFYYTARFSHRYQEKDTKIPVFSHI